MSTVPELKVIEGLCPRLRALESAMGFQVTGLQGLGQSKDGRKAEAILQLTALCELKLFFEPCIWATLLPGLTCLSLLRTLADVQVSGSEDLAALAALTGLSALAGIMKAGQWVVSMQALTGLRRVAVMLEREEVFGVAPNAEIIVRQLPELCSSLESFCLCTEVPTSTPLDLGALTSMTRLERVALCFHRGPQPNEGRWSMEGAATWCQHLSWLRQLELVGKPTGCPALGVLAHHLTRLDHLRLRLEDFDGVTQLSALTRLTLLQIVKDGALREVSAPAMDPPIFLTALHRLRHFSLHWVVGSTCDKARETFRYLAALTELERLQLRHLRRSSITKCKECNTVKDVGVHTLRPVSKLWLLQRLQWEGLWRINWKTQQRIHELRAQLGLPILNFVASAWDSDDVYSKML